MNNQVFRTKTWIFTELLQIHSQTAVSINVTMPYIKCQFSWQEHIYDASNFCLHRRLDWMSKVLTANYNIWGMGLQYVSVGQGPTAVAQVFQNCTQINQENSYFISRQDQTASRRHCWLESGQEDLPLTPCERRFSSVF